MLRKTRRLKREEFNRFFSVGKRFHCGAFQLIYSPFDSFHASVVVPKKIIRSAAKRNKLRRRVYDILRLYNRMYEKGGVFIVIIKPTAATMSYLALENELTGIVGRIENKG